MGRLKGNEIKNASFGGNFFLIQIGNLFTFLIKLSPKLYEGEIKKKAEAYWTRWDVSMQKIFIGDKDCLNLIRNFEP